jgi:hypothetical protein
MRPILLGPMNVTVTTERRHEKPDSTSPRPRLKDPPHRRGASERSGLVIARRCGPPGVSMDELTLSALVEQIPRPDPG